MNQRREPRVELQQPVAVTVLSDPPVRHTANARNACGRGLALEMSAPLSPGTAIRVEIDDSMMLGEMRISWEWNWIRS